MMNRLMESLAQFCSSHLLEDKILIVPSLAAGHQLLEDLPRNGHPWVNLHVQTVGSLAAQTIGPDLALAGKRLLSRAQSLALVEQACLQVIGDGSYFAQLRDRPGFHKAVQRTLADVRASGIPTDALSPKTLETERKSDDLRAITAAYGKLLADGGFVDSTDVLRMALDKAKADRSEPASWYLIPGGTEVPDVEREFLETLAGDRLLELAADDPADWLHAELEITRALGEENEIRAVFRRILSEGLPFDAVEIIYTDSVTYIPLVHELSSQYGVPCTFAQGIPVMFTGPGQAASVFLEWLESGFDANVLRRGIAEGCFDLTGVSSDASNPGALACSKVIREAGIGWGRDRHLSRIDALARHYETRINKPRSDDEGNPKDVSYLEDRLRTVQSVRAFVERLVDATISATDDEGVDYTALASGLSRLLDDFAAVNTDLDGMARRALSGLLLEFSDLPAVRMSAVQAAERLREAVAQVHVSSQTPKPGCVHVSEYRTGGYSGRAHTFLVGLDDSRHPGRPVQDPVLLDGERTRINITLGTEQLALRSARTAENTTAMKSCLARLRGSVTISFSCRDLLEDREQFPSATVLEAFRLLRGEPDADYSRMLACLDAPAGFVAEGDECLDDTEWWLASVRRTPVTPETEAYVRSVYPWLESGRLAEAGRASAEFTRYDGLVDMQAPELDPCTNGRILSASRIQSLAGCPFAYFVRHVLGIQPVEDIEFDPSCWLDPLDNGTLLHDAFREFSESVSARGEKPSFDRHLPELLAIARSHIERYAEKIPPPNDAAFKVRTDEILRTCRIFLKMEEEHCREATPCFFEVPFGYGTDDARSPISSEEPVSIAFGDGRSFLFAGRIDRIDRDGDGNWEVWDYKTGGRRAFREESEFNGGRQLQYALYAVAAEQLLRRAGHDGAVSRSGYIFPSLKGEGSRIARTADIGAMRSVLSDLFEILQAGAFASSSDSKDCGYCDFAGCCGGPERAPKRTEAKMQCAANTVLEPFRRLRGNCERSDTD